MKWIKILMLGALVFPLLHADAMDDFAHGLQFIAASTPREKKRSLEETEADIKMLLQKFMQTPKDQKLVQELQEAFKNDLDFNIDHALEPSVSAVGLALRHWKNKDIQDLLRRSKINPNARGFPSHEMYYGNLLGAALADLNMEENVPMQLEIIDFLLRQQGINLVAECLVAVETGDYGKKIIVQRARPIAFVLFSKNNELIKKFLAHPNAHANAIFSGEREDWRSVVLLEEEIQRGDKGFDESDRPLVDYIRIVEDYDEYRHKKSHAAFLKHYEKASDEYMEVIFRRAIGLGDTKMIALLNEKDKNKYSFERALLYAMDMNRAASIFFLLVQLHITSDDYVYITGIENIEKQRDAYGAKGEVQATVSELRAQELDAIKDGYAKATKNYYVSVNNAFRMAPKVSRVAPAAAA